MVLLKTDSEKDALCQARGENVALVLASHKPDEAPTTSAASVAVSIEPSSSSRAVRIARQTLAVKATNSVAGHLPGILEARPYKPYGLKPIPSRVIEEEDYVDILQRIIERDFFPDLTRLRQEKERIEADATGQILRSQQILNQIKKKRGHKSTDIRRVNLLDGREFEIDLNQLSLTEFQSLFTSEDNASFEKIVQEEKAKLSNEQEWIERATLRHNLLNEETRLAIQNGKKVNRLIYSDLDARNPFMFPITDGNVGISHLQRVAIGGKQSEETVALCAGDYSSHYKPQASNNMDHSNTRIEMENDEDGIGSVLLLKMRKEQINKLNQKEQNQKNDKIFDIMITTGEYSGTLIQQRQQLDALNRKSRNRVYNLNDLQHIGLQSPSATPSHQGYHFVHTPAIEPGIDDASPIMTWGSIGATPLLLSKEEETTQSKIKIESEATPLFFIQEPSSKELAAQQLSDSVAKKFRSQKKRHASNVVDVLRANTPKTGSSTGLFGTPRLTATQLLRAHSNAQRTPRTGLRSNHHRPFPTAATAQSSPSPFTELLASQPKSKRGKQAH